MPYFKPSQIRRRVHHVHSDTPDQITIRHLQSELERSNRKLREATNENVLLKRRLSRLEVAKT